MGTASFGNIGAHKTHAVQRALHVIHVIAGLALAALGAAMLSFVPWSEMARHFDASDWPITEGRVVSVSLAEDRRAEIGAERPVAELVLSVIYEYEVGGEVFTGDRASFNDRSDPVDRRLRGLFGRLNFARLMGRTVPVAYDPDEPSSAYLDRDFDWQPAAWRAGIGLGAVVFGVGLVAGSLRSRSNASLL